MKLFLLAFGVVAIMTSIISEGYEIETHAQITNAAHAASQLGVGTNLIQKKLGIDAWVNKPKVASAPFGVSDTKQIYFDLLGGVPKERSVQPFELNVMERANIDPKLSVQLPGWLMRGVIREDDINEQVDGISYVRSLFQEKAPLDDPYGNINRFCNHFLDPIAVINNPTSGGLVGFCFAPLNTVFANAASWALGSDNPFVASPTENTGRRNHFTILDARESMWRGLTLTDKAAIPLSTSIFPQNTYTPEEVRKVYWATTFRALGDVLHTLQDQAQPQHTRNEGHGASNTGYEEYINARAKRAPFYSIDGDTLFTSKGQLPDLTFLGYNVPRFNRYSDYWTTANANKLGIADYSNNGFFTFESNFGNTVYANPSSDPAVKTYTPDRSLVTIWGAPYNLLMGTVKDNVANLDTEVISMSTKGVFGEAILADSSITPKSRL